MTVKPRLTEADKQAAAKRLGIKLSALKAVCDVESRGSGFLSAATLVSHLNNHPQSD